MIARLGFISSVANHLSRITRHNRIIRHIFSDDTAHADHGAVANRDTIDDAGLSSYPYIFADNDAL